MSATSPTARTDGDARTDDGGQVGGLAAIGERPLVQGFALAGAQVFEADTPEAVRAAWAGLAPTVTVVVLSAAAAGALQAETVAPGAPFTVVLP